MEQFNALIIKTQQQKRKKKINTLTENGDTGILEVPTINLSKVFLANEYNSLSCVDTSVCAYNWNGNSPDKKDSNLILGAHNGTNDNSFFNRIENINEGNLAYIEYKGKQYKYKMAYKYRVKKSTDIIKIDKEPEKLLYLFTEDKKDNYSKYYLVLKFKFVSQEELE